MPLGDRIRGRIRHGLYNPLSLDWSLKFAATSLEDTKYVQCPLWTEKNVGVTFSFWIKSDRLDGNYAQGGECILYVGKYGPALTPGYNGYMILWGRVAEASKRLALWQYNVLTTWALTLDLNFLNWTHIAIELIDEGTTIHSKSYVNGVLNRERTGLDKGTVLPTTQSFFGSDEKYIGLINTHPLRENVWLDEMRVWERILSDAEIKADMFNAPSLANLVAWYRMNEGSGTITTDFGGQSKNGTINGAEWSLK